MLNKDELYTITPAAKPDIVNGCLNNWFLLMTTTEGQPHRFAMLWANLCHESDGLKTTREYASGEDYEGRADLGNTEPGDGKRFRGRGLIQVTGRGNYERYQKWLTREAAEMVTERFQHITPEKLEDFPHALLSAIWFWELGNFTGKSLNKYADDGNFDWVVRVINGGYNGMTSRREYYMRTGLRLLGYAEHFAKSIAIASFQDDHNLIVDGIAGPQTWGKMHEVLAMQPVWDDTEDEAKDDMAGIKEELSLLSATLEGARKDIDSIISRLGK